MLDVKYHVSYSATINCLYFFDYLDIVNVHLRHLDHYNSMLYGVMGEDKYLH